MGELRTIPLVHAFTVHGTVVSDIPVPQVEVAVLLLVSPP